MEKIYTIVGAFEDIGEPSRFDVIGSYRSLDKAEKAMYEHIKLIFSKIIPEDELNEFINCQYCPDGSWFYDDDNGLITIFNVVETTLND